jgi:Flp pilus assembly protein TadB
MSEPVLGGIRAEIPPPDPKDASTGELIGQLTDQVTRLVRDEVRLAQAEVTQKAKRLGIGAGLFGGAGATALLAVNALLVALILGIATTGLPGWVAAIIVAGGLLLIAAVLALLGKKETQEATPPLPTEAIASVQADIATVKERISR